MVSEFLGVSKSSATTSSSLSMEDSPTIEELVCQDLCLENLANTSKDSTNLDSRVLS